MIRDIDFTDGETRYGGVLFDRGQPRTVVALPDWRGFTTDYARRRGTELSQTLGCNVVVSDLYGLAYRPAGYAGDAERWISRALADPLGLRSRLTGFFTALAGAVACPADQISVVGYCLGGGACLRGGPCRDRP